MFNFNKNNNNPVIQIEWYTFSAHSSYSSDQPRDGHKRKRMSRIKGGFSCPQLNSGPFVSCHRDKYPGFLVLIANYLRVTEPLSGFYVSCATMLHSSPRYYTTTTAPSTCVCPCCSSVLRCADRIIIKSSRISAASLWILFIVLFILVPNY